MNRWPTLSFPFYLIIMRSPVFPPIPQSEFKTRGSIAIVTDSRHKVEAKQSKKHSSFAKEVADLCAVFDDCLSFPEGTARVEKPIALMGH